MGIARHQANTFQATGHKAAKELEPKFPVFGGAHVQSQDLSFAGRRQPMAITTAVDTTRPSCRTFKNVASSQT